MASCRLAGQLTKWPTDRLPASKTRRRTEAPNAKYQVYDRRHRHPPHVRSQLWPSAFESVPCCSVPPEPLQPDPALPTPPSWWVCGQLMADGPLALGVSKRQQGRRLRESQWGLKSEIPHILFELSGGRTRGGYPVLICIVILRVGIYLF